MHFKSKTAFENAFGLSEPLKFKSESKSVFENAFFGFLGSNRISRPYFHSQMGREERGATISATVVQSSISRFSFNMATS